MENTIRILQAGGTSWQELYRIPDEVEWLHIPSSADSVPEDIADTTYDAVIIDGKISDKAYACLEKKTEPYTSFFTDRYVPDRRLQGLLADCYARKIIDEEGFIQTIPLRFYKGQEGYKLHIKDMEITDPFRWNIRYIGEEYVELSVDEEPCFRQAAFFRYNAPLNIYARRAVDIWPEFRCQGDICLKYRVRMYSEEVSGTLLWEKVIEGEDLNRPILITEADRGYLAVQIYVCGRGRVELGPVHVRYSRLGLGHFLPGGRRHAASDRGELISYFHPGDRKPPLVVYFAGYRTAEGFEGRGIMRSLGSVPYLLLADPRLEGGAFYTGADDYEGNTAVVIQDALNRLHFNSDQVVFSGLSMGTYGAVYYGCRFLPKAIVIGKPILNLGTVADNERKNRMGQFPTSLDYLLMMTGGTKQEHIDRLDQRLWDRFNKADFRNTQFSIAYMLQDDYDKKAYTDIIQHLEDKSISVVGKGLEGRHNDNTAGVVHWFMGQLRRILREEFQREAHGNDR